MDEKKQIDPSVIKELPLNARINIAVFNVSEALMNIQALCGIDNATMALIVESRLSDMRRELCAEATMQYVQMRSESIPDKETE